MNTQGNPVVRSVVFAFVAGAAAVSAWAIIVRPIGTERAQLADKASRAQAILQGHARVRANDGGTKPDARAFERALEDFTGILVQDAGVSPADTLRDAASTYAVTLEELQGSNAAPVTLPQSSQGFRAETTKLTFAVTGSLESIARFLGRCEQENGPMRVRAFQIVSPDSQDTPGAGRQPDGGTALRARITVVHLRVWRDDSARGSRTAPASASHASAGGGA